MSEVQQQDAIKALDTIQAGVAQSNEKVANLAKSQEEQQNIIAELAKSQKEFIELQKSEKIAELAKKEAELQAKEAELAKKEQESLSKSANKRMINDMTQGSSQEKSVALVKSERKDELVEFLKSASKFPGKERVEVGLGQHIAENIVERAVNLSKSTPYSQDVDGLGGFGVRPTYLQTIDITNYTNEDKAMALFGVENLPGTTAVRNRVDRDFDTNTDAIKAYAEHEIFTEMDAISFYKPMDIKLSAVKASFKVTESLLINDPEVVNIQLAAMEADMNRRIVRQALSKVSAFKNVKSIPEEIASVLSSNVVETTSSGSIVIEDIIEGLFNAGKLLADNLVNPVIIVNPKLVNSLAVKKEYGRLTNRELINLQGQAFSTAWGNVPFITINKDSLFNAKLTSATAGDTVAILMDRSAFKFYMCSKGANLQQTPAFYASEDQATTYLQTMYAGGFVHDPYKISILKVKA